MQAIIKEVDKMLEEGIIEPFTSVEFASSYRAEEGWDASVLYRLPQTQCRF